LRSGLRRVCRRGRITDKSGFSNIGRWMWLSIRKRLTARGTKSGFTAFRRHSAIRWRGVEFRSDFCCLFLIVFNNLKHRASRAEQLPSLGKQPGVLGEVGDELPHVVTLHLEAQGPD